MRILIVEDDPDVVAAVSMVLRLRWADAEIAHAARGSDALEKLRAAGADIVLLDLGLPDKDGKEVIVEMRGFSDAPIIVLTAPGSRD